MRICVDQRSDGSHQLQQGAVTVGNPNPVYTGSKVVCIGSRRFLEKLYRYKFSKKQLLYLYKIIFTVLSNLGLIFDPSTINKVKALIHQFIDPEIMHWCIPCLQRFKILEI
jgi:hypothetical protein